MKITAFLLLISFLTVSAGTFAQKITLKAQRASLEKVLDQIRQQSGIDIVYSNDVISKSGPVNIDVKNATVEEALKNCLKDQPLTFDIEDGTVVIKAKEESLLDKAKALFAQVTVTGKVIDENGFPMAGVTVKQKGTTNATATDVKGTFSLTVPDNSTIITLTFVGYEPKELISKDIKGATITLVAAPQSLHEVQIFKGYYSQKEEENTGDVTVVHADVLEQQPVDNPIVALEGRVPGMVITQTSGVAGSGITVQIRGQSSLSQGTNPLYVVDGVPYSSTMLQSIGYNILGGSSAGGTVGSPLNFIDPKDIESIEVLKDADATSIYGSRGANGVILITTKKGKVGAAKADVRYEEGFGQVGHFLNLLNTQQYLQVRREAFKNDGVTIPSSPTSGYDINGTWDTTRYTNWQKVLIGGTSHYTDAHGTVSGGTENIQYNIIGGYHRETTVFPGDFADQKISVLANLSTSSANKRFKTSLSVSYLNDNNNLNQTDLTSFITYDPDAPPPYNANGTLNWGPSNDFSNPFQYTYKTYKVTTNNLIAHSHISYTIIPGLEISTSLGYTNMQGNESTASPFGFQLNKTGNNSTLTGSASFINNSVQSWDVDPQISYQAKLGPGKISALLGSTITDNSTNGQWLNGSGYSSDVLLGSLLGAVSITAGPITNSEYRYNALLARIGYAAYDGKYVLNLTANRDGSSRFGPGRQFANFGSVGMAWNFYKEKYVQDAFPFLSFGKLRGSYGTTGNDQIGDYQYLDLYNIISSTVPYQGAQSLQNTTLYNPDLEWEIDRKLEGGLELGFLKDRLLLSISYFRNRSSNQLVGEQLPSITGNGSITANLPATVQNTGLELELNTTNIKKGDFSWSTNFNLTIPKNELLSFPGQASSTFHNLIIGQPITSLHVFQYAGVNPTTGLYQFQTANGTLTSTPNPSTDLLASVNLAPKFYGGFGNTFTYKSLRLDFFFTFTKQEAPNPLFALSSAEPGYKNVNLLAGVLNRWQSPGQTGVAVEQFSQSFGNAYTAYANVGQSTYDYVDGSYIRLKNLSLSYNLPNIWKQKLGIQSWNVFLLGQNLFTLTKYQGLDPETRSMTSLPTLRVITVGLQIGF
ncbi:SusC/RagA family TonB-linked outer membrane protein [Mucilaginibacter sp. X4EP1]|uniref:SusC/RagA family TonB-linked outer membrane protein n=1 Tax=Mucilaginibacter sp. X4EP1 TaxID=2723092 RepID=UPI002166FF01|nr:SusC/RagA family TonB-linked outer membrane protein [Mucilaginibacter sp. X4EP1]MCS3815486.1 TonB-linked SusC/RagA family outer membrane protein [Mucilaginibacter sp. X4EP1]